MQERPLYLLVGNMLKKALAKLKGQDKAPLLHSDQGWQYQMAAYRKQLADMQEMLQTMGLRAFTPMVTACPGCGRTTSSFFQELAHSIQEHVRDNMPKWRGEYDGVENMTLAVMGCVVNGPGESKHANIGISLPGTGEAPAAPVFEDGVKTVTLRGERIAEEFTAIVDRYVARTYQRKIVSQS